MPEPGLRERKRRRTRDAIADAALALFRESGFDAVSVADVADAAEVSKPTVFAYFPAKEDLVVHQFVDERDPARIVRERDDGTSPLAALRQAFLDRLAARDQLVGLDDSPSAIACHQLLYATPALLGRLAEYLIGKERDLVDELRGSGGVADDFTARLVAAHVFGTQRILSFQNAQDIRDGQSADDAYPAAVSRAEQAFDLLERAVGA